MLRHGFRVIALSAGVAVWLAVLGGAARAHDTLQECVDESTNHNGEPPTCTQVNGKWVATWPDESASSGGSTAAIAVLLVLGLLVAGGLIIWKVSTAQKLAKQSGLDPSVATQMTLLTDDGLEATYLAASLRPAPATESQSPSGSAPTPRPVSDRLSELLGLLDQGVITQAEYDEQRKAIIDQV